MFTFLQLYQLFVYKCKIVSCLFISFVWISAVCLLLKYCQLFVYIFCNYISCLFTITGMVSNYESQEKIFFPQFFKVLNRTCMFIRYFRAAAQMEQCSQEQKLQKKRKTAITFRWQHPMGRTSLCTFNRKLLDFIMNPTKE